MRGSPATSKNSSRPERLDMTDIQERPSIDPDISVDDFTAQATEWYEANAVRRATHEAGLVWGEGDFDVSVFSDMSFEDEQAHILSIAAWIQKKASQGYHAVDWPVEYGGLGLSRAHARALGRIERQFQSPGSHELVSVTVGLVASTIRVLGSDALKERFVADLRAANTLACQLFSEPGAGSDLAGLATRAVRDGDEWVVNGQKVWSSGAQFSQWGELIARTDPDVVKQQGLTAFMLPLDAPGVEVRPIKQMSGGSSFCEVFFSDVRISDDLRLGEVGEGWKVATTTLSFERDHSESGGEGSASGGSWKQLLATARMMGVTEDPVMRDKLAKVYIHGRVESFTNRRAADLARSGTPGPEGSLGKLLWTEGMTEVGSVIGDILGARLLADTGEWGTYAWNEHLLGAPGYRIAGGSDEIQRNIVGERVLGLPREPRADSGPWSSIPR
jgi:alkylation response protein AidB-like acyl-CoA dehydrogenase